MFKSDVGQTLLAALIVAGTLCLTVNCACRVFEKNISSPVELQPPGKAVTLLDIRPNTQQSYEQVSIGAGNFRYAGYTDEQGLNHEGPTVDLSIGAARDHVAIRAHTGKRVVVGGYVLEVVQIDMGGLFAERFVRVAVTVEDPAKVQ